ncbi:zinc-ribbon domain-containing protein [Blastopirellula marina]|nr:hypothetical protein C5Y98_31120 [Blastopirellula marina]PTL40697.1 zinc-ribbon domain-containing protein [Blastopirellula marina]
MFSLTCSRGKERRLASESVSCRKSLPGGATASRTGSNLLSLLTGFDAMIIWGSTGRDTNCGHGDFFCPGCRNDSGYAHQRVQRYFTLYFIPLFPINTVGEYLQCHTCGSQYDVKLLEVPREQIQALVSPWQCGRCGNNNPGEYSECLACKSGRTALQPGPKPLPRLGSRIDDDDIIEAERI